MGMINDITKINDVNPPVDIIYTYTIIWEGFTDF